MFEKKPLGVLMIGSFYFFGAGALLVSLFTRASDEVGIALRFGVPGVQESYMRAIVAFGSIFMAYGFIRLKKWGYWFMLIYTVYFLGVSITLSQLYHSQPFYGNVLWSFIVLVYTIYRRKYFVEKGVV